MSSSVGKLRVDATLDLRGLQPPEGYHAAVKQLQGMAEQEILELHLDEEAMQTVPFGLRAEGHEIVVSEPASAGIRLLVRKRAPIA